MGDYAQACRTFSWKEVEKQFSWHKTGKVNIAYEAIDRFAEDPATGTQACLTFESDTRKERYTYSQMKELTNKFGNLLRKLGVRKGDRVLIFLL